MSKTPWIFVDCEARGTSPAHGVLTEFGAVHYDTRDTFYGRLFHATPDPENPAISIAGARMATDKEVAESFAAWLRGHLGDSRPVFVSDNPAYDWQWIAGMFDRAGMDSPFGHSGRRSLHHEELYRVCASAFPDQVIQPRCEVVLQPGRAFIDVIGRFPQRQLR
jgi:hypothetical protein